MIFPRNKKIKIFKWCINHYILGSYYFLAEVTLKAVNYFCRKLCCAFFKSAKRPKYRILSRVFEIY